MQRQTRMHALRKPLFDWEAEELKAVVCVTGATGYIGSSVIQRLLASGHTVHAVDCDVSQASTDHLTSLEAAASSLHFFKASLDGKSGYDKAMQSAKYVIHLASPVLFDAKAGEERQSLLEPAVRLVECVFAAVNRSDSVERVVFTSSVGAVVGDYAERVPGHIFTENDWALTPTETYLPYSFSKLLAERKAMEITSKQTRWTLVTILPGIVQGPPLGRRKGESVGIMRSILMGEWWPFAPEFVMPLVDVDDVAAAISLAMITREATGRYIIVGHNLTNFEYCNLLRPIYNARKLPIAEGPRWFFHCTRIVFGRPTWSQIKSLHGRAKFDTSRARLELGMQFMDPRTTALDMATRVVELGFA